MLTFVPLRDEDRLKSPCCCLGEAVEQRCLLCPQHGGSDAWHAVPKLRGYLVVGRTHAALVN
jgi:hypothetical protein